VPPKGLRFSAPRVATASLPASTLPPPSAAPDRTTPAGGAAAPTKWIIGPRADLAWFVLPAITGYLCLYVNVALGVSSFLIWWLWNVAMNGPHFFATLSRTYLDRDEWRERTPLLLGSLSVVLIGPLALWASIASGSALPFLGFWALQVTWAYYHVARQHYGFLAIYQRLNGESSGSANHADFWIFHVVMFGPVLAWFLQYPELREALGWTARLSGPEQTIVVATRAAVVAAIVLYVGKEAGGYFRRRTINVPKSALLLAYVPLHLLLLLYPTVAGRYDILLFNAVVTLPHNFQYLGIVWFYSKNRYHGAADSRAYGWAPHASASLPRFLGLGLLFSVLFFYSRWYFEGQNVPFSLGRFAWAHAPLGRYRVADLVGAIWIGFIFHHQYLDQRIWKISRDRQLNRDLHLARARDAA